LMMIAYLDGTLLARTDDRIILLAGHVGYEVHVPSFVMQTLGSCEQGDPVKLHIYYHQTERQPRPVLIGFTLEAEREFFQHFLTVEAIGPLKAVKALTMPIREIARAIEDRNIGILKRLNGIGERTAQKIIATLRGKMGKFALIRENEPSSAPVCLDFVDTVMTVLIGQLGHRPNEARQMVDEALKRDPAIANPEDLFEEVYRGEKSDG
jgi:holliday junction DNA helicase RuvA